VTARALTAKTVDLVALVKPNIMIMALLTAAGAMSLAPGTIHAAKALWLLAGTATIVGAANTLNMWLERDIDCLMSRTKDRPLPKHRLEPVTAVVFGSLLGVAGLPYVVTAIALGAMVLVQGFSGDGSTKWARNVFLTSIVYLPILFAVMVASGNA